MCSFSEKVNLCGTSNRFQNFMLNLSSDPTLYLHVIPSKIHFSYSQK